MLKVWHLKNKINFKKNQDEIELILLIYLFVCFNIIKTKNKQTKKTEKKSNDWALKVSFNKTAIAYLTKSKLITSLTPGLIILVCMILCNRCKSVKCRFSGWLNRTRLLPLNSLICHFRLIQAICVKDISPNLKSCELMRDGTGTFQCKADVFLTLDSLDCLSAWVPTGLVLRRIPGALLWKPEKRKVTRMHECEG